ncbi:MAG: hypothetical protein QOD35_1325 [Nocardioidaceae bacterium]|jgi:hypothetical protein|nr:hypothetical protein [Nocardioidaceae bacterium]
MTGADLAAVVAALAAAGPVDWSGLPAGLRGAPDDETFEVVLGAERDEADLLQLPDVADGCAARAWLRGGVVVLVEITWRTGAPAWPPDSGEGPEARDDVVDGLVVVEAGEWIYPQRGLAVVTNQDATAARRMFGFAPTTLDVYRRLLRPDLSTVRRPAVGMTRGDDL